MQRLIALMKEGSKIIDLAIETTRKCRRRKGTNFSKSKQRQQRDLKRKEDVGVATSGSLRKPRANKVGEKPFWQLGCKIWALDLEPIDKVGQLTADQDLLRRNSKSPTMAQR